MKLYHLEASHGMSVSQVPEKCPHKIMFRITRDVAPE